MVIFLSPSSPRKRGPSNPGAICLRTVSRHIQICVYWVPGLPRFARSPGTTAGNPSHRIPRKHIAGALERRERWSECAFELLVQLLRCPAIGAMDGADRARLVEQEYLVVAHREDLPA